MIPCLYYRRHGITRLGFGILGLTFRCRLPRPCLPRVTGRLPRRSSRASPRRPPSAPPGRLPMTSAGGSASIAADRVNPPPFKRLAAADRKVPHHPPWRRRRHLRTALPWWQSRPPSDARALPRAAVVAAGARARLIHLVAGGLLGCRSASTRPDGIRQRPWRGAAHSCGIRHGSRRGARSGGIHCRPGEIRRHNRQGAARPTPRQDPLRPSRRNLLPSA